MDYSLPGSSVHGIFQARVLEWVVISFSRGSSRPRDRTQVSRIVSKTLYTQILRSGFFGSWGGSIFNFLEELPYCFSQWLQQFIFSPTAHRVLFSPHPYKHLLFIVFLMIAILTGVWWYLSVVLICIYLMTSDVEHLFMYLLATYVSLEKCLFKSSAHF